MEVKNFVGLASDHAAFQLKQFVKPVSYTHLTLPTKA